MAFRGWIASLSTGETVFEPDGMAGNEGWKELLQRFKAEDVRLTQLRLQRGGMTVVAIPGADGFFQGYEYRNTSRGTRKQVQGIGSIVGQQVFITWLDDDGNCWQDVREVGAVWGGVVQ